MIAVITPSLPERAGLLAELCADLAAQTYRDFEHLIGVDEERVGPALVRNRLVASSTAEWLAFVDDDDRVYPDHLAVLLEIAGSGADVCYTLCDGFDVPHDCSHVSLLGPRNTVPVTTLVRRSMFVGVGGFPQARYEDFGLWKRIVAAGGRFQCDHRVTWEYRMHGANRTFA